MEKTEFGGLTLKEEMKAMNLCGKAVEKSRQWRRVLKNLDGRGDNRLTPAERNAIALADKLVKDKSKSDRKKITLIVKGIDDDLKDLTPRFSKPRQWKRTGL